MDAEEANKDLLGEQASVSSFSSSGSIPADRHSQGLFRLEEQAKEEQNHTLST